MTAVLKRILLALLALTLFLYLAAMSYLFFRQESLLFFPDPESPAAAAAFSAFDTRFEVNGQHLDGWFIPGTSPGTLVYYGGNADELSRQLDDIPRLVDSWNYLLINYRGYGESTGSPGEAALKEDARAILAASSERFGFSIPEALVMGRSLGSGVAIDIASVFPLKGLILVTPYDSVRAVAQARYPIFPVGLLLRHPFDSLAYTGTIDEPTLVLKAQSDRVIPHRHTDTLVAQWRSPVSVATLPGNHGNVMSSPVFRAEVRSFISRLADDAPANTEEAP